MVGTDTLERQCQTKQLRLEIRRDNHPGLWHSQCKHPTPLQSLVTHNNTKSRRRKPTRPQLLHLFRLEQTATERPQFLYQFRTKNIKNSSSALLLCIIDISGSNRLISFARLCNGASALRTFNTAYVAARKIKKMIKYVRLLQSLMLILA